MFLHGQELCNIRVTFVMFKQYELITLLDGPRILTFKANTLASAIYFTKTGTLVGTVYVVSMCL